MLGLFLWAALVLLRNLPVLRYALSAGAWDLSAAIFPVLLVAVFLILAWGAGLRLCRLLGAPTQGVFFFLPTALGLGATGLLLLIAGLAGGLQAGLCLSAAALALAGAAPVVEALRAWRPVLPGRLPYWKQALAAGLGFCAFHVLVSALAPAVGWDALAYHLAIPQIYFREGAVLELPWLLHSHWPHLMELLYAIPLALGQETAAALLHGSLCAALVLSVWRLGRLEGGSAAGWAAAALLAAQPVFLEVAVEPHADGALVLFHLLACVLLWRWSKEGGKGLLACAGLCSGLAAACKLQGLVLLGVLFLWLLCGRQRRSGALAFLCWAAVPAAPWYLKTWAFTGNPFWPFYAKVFGGKWDPLFIDQALARTNLWRLPRDSALLWRYSPHFLILPAAGILLAAPRRVLPPFLRFLFWPALPLAVVSLPYHEAWRYLLPLLPALALACGWWCAQACSRPGLRRAAGCLLLGLGLLPVLKLTQSNELFAVLGLKSRQFPGLSAQDVYRARQLPFFLFYKKAAAVLPPGATVLLFREVRGYHLASAYQWGDPVIQTQVEYDTLSPDTLAARLRELGITYVLTNAGNGLYGSNEDYYKGRTIALMEEMLKIHGETVLEEGPMRLTALRGL